MGILQNTWPYFWPYSSSHPTGWHSILAFQTCFHSAYTKIQKSDSWPYKPSLTNLANLASHSWPHSPDLNVLATFVWPHITLSFHNCPHTPGHTILASNSRPGLIKLASHTGPFYVLASNSWPSTPFLLYPALLALLFSCHCMASHSLATMASLCHSFCHFMPSHSSCHFWSHTPLVTYGLTPLFSLNSFTLFFSLYGFTFLWSLYGLALL